MRLRGFLAVTAMTALMCAATTSPAGAASAEAATGAPAASATSASSASAAQSQPRLPDPPAPRHPKALAAAEAPSRPGAVPAGEEIVTATSDTNGYHLFAASAGDHWQWHALATLQPGGYSDEAWIGEHCTTGDGRYVIAVVAPWSANNSDAGIAAGGFAYAVNAHTGAVRPLAAGLMLSYFNPGCGTGSSVALSRYTSADQSSTQIITVDAATGASTATPVIGNQVTSAIPVNGALFAAEGRRLVRITSHGDAGTLATYGGPVFDLTPNTAGAVDYLAQDNMSGKDPAMGAYRLAGGKTARLASGTLKTLRLLPGLNGHDSIAGSTGKPDGAVATRSVARGVSVDSFADASTLGSVAVKPTAAKSGTAPGTVDLISLTGASVGGGKLPAAASPYRTLPAWAGTVAAKSSSGDTVPGKATSGKTASGTAASPHPAAVPVPPGGGGDAGATCAVPRDDPNYQVPQPSDAQIDWALNLAGQYGLPVRSSSYANLNTGQYDPSADFPLPAPFDGTTGIPRQIMEGIFAQESNWKQASPHAPAGLSGNPLIADYYGIYNQQNTTGYIDFSLADCGYGLGQITDMMRLSSPGNTPTTLQKRVALDYAENAAATAQTLADKWNQLSGDGITVGDDNPMQIEDWYFAIWAYNSGVNPQAATGNTTGCTPGPSCADSAGNWGLGWTNNPANPTYDPLRHPFLHDDLGDLTYGDAATPQDWPYQEKVFGWIESGQYESDGVTLKYSPTYDYGTGAGFFLDLPSVYAFCDSSDNCDPLASQPCGYNAKGDPLQWHCWWHKSAGSCFGGCHTGDWDYTVNDAEPAVANPFPSVCSPPGDFTDTYIVDDSMSETNLAGCAGMPAANAPMVWLPDQDPNGQPFGDVDLHQLGTGYGGRTMFTHLEDTGNSLWGGTMAWAPNNLDYDVYDIEVFIPSLGAAGTLTYTVYNQGLPIANVPLDQNNYGNQWVSIGTYYLAPGAKVTTTNVVSGGDGATDVAFDAIAFRPVSSYVSLGDSYSSGEGTGSYDPGTDASGVNQCHRSPNSYARVWAAAHGASGVPMVQLACSGAVTANLTTTGQWNEPAQIPATPKHAIKVFLTIGGNDVGFAAVLTRCLNPLLTCEDYYNQDDGNNEDNVIDALEPQLAGVYTQITQRAPHAAVTVLTYPSLFEPASTCPSIANLPVSDVTWLIGEAAHLDDVVVQAAKQAGIQAVDTRDAFVGQELCTSSPWVYSLPIPWPSGTQVFDSSAWFHPTAPGQAQLASYLAANVTAPSIRGFATATGAWMPRHLPPGVPAGAGARNELTTLNTRGKVVATLPVPTVAYNRDDPSQFGSGWRSRQNCDARNRVLRRDALTVTDQPTNFVPLVPAVGTPINTACPVTEGMWDWPYEASTQTPAAPVLGQYLTQDAIAGAGGMQIDHIVPLKNAWNSGASNWAKNTRVDFANDLNLPQLWAVSQPSNGSKSDQDPSQWMPPNTGISCIYASAWVEVKYKYGLLMTQTEYNSLTTTLASCP